MRICLMMLCVLLLPALAQAQDKVELGKRWEILQETNADWTVAQVDSAALPWEPSRWAAPNLGFTSDTYWMRLELHADELESGYWRLWIRNSLLSDVHWYLFEDGKLIQQREDGLWRRLDERATSFRYPAFLFKARSGSAYRMYLRVRSETALQVPAELISEAAFIAAKARDDLVLGLFVGVLIAMMLYNLVLYLTVREIGFLLYVGHVGALLLFVASWQGLGATYIWPDLIALQSYSIALATFLVIGFSTWFCGVFLDLNAESFSWLKIFWGVRNAAFAGVLITPLLPVQWSVFASSLLSVVAIFLVIRAILTRASLRHRPTRLFAMGWALYVSGAFMMALNKFGWIEVTSASENLLLWSSVFDMMLLCIALGDRFHVRRVALIQKQEIATESAGRTLEGIDARLGRARAARQALQQAIGGQEDFAGELERRLRERGQALDSLKQQLQMASEHDGLTGLKNRRYFSDRIFEEVERNRHLGTQFSVLVIDVDRFREINEMFGHLAGDECLRQIAETLRLRLRRPADVLCRIGGEKFAVLLPDTAAEGALQLAENIRGRIAACPMLCAGQRIMATVSVGVSEVLQQKGQYAEWGLLQAGKALQQAKAEGRNCVALAG